MIGRVHSFDVDRGYGWITDEHTSYFVHCKEVCTDVNGLQVLYPGDIVEFESVQQPPKRSGARARVVAIIKPQRIPVTEPAPRECGQVIRVVPTASGQAYAIGKRWPPCCGIFIAPYIVSSLGLRVGDWIDFTPSKSRHKRPDGRPSFWNATNVCRVEVIRKAKHADEEVEADYKS